MPKIDWDAAMEYVRRIEDKLGEELQEFTRRFPQWQFEFVIEDHPPRIILRFSHLPIRDERRSELYHAATTVGGVSQIELAHLSEKELEPVAEFLACFEEAHRIRIFRELSPGQNRLDAPFWYTLKPVPYGRYFPLKEERGVLQADSQTD